MLMTKKKANRLIKEAYVEGVDQGYEVGLEVGHERGYKSIDVWISEDKVREIVDKINNENKRYRYL